MWWRTSTHEKIDNKKIVRRIHHEGEGKRKMAQKPEGIQMENWCQENPFIKKKRKLFFYYRHKKMNYYL